MVQQSRTCAVCGKGLGYIAGLRGFGIRERRHAARCLARPGNVMACVSMENPVSKTLEVEDAQSSIQEPAEDCVKLQVNRRSAIVDEWVSEAEVEERLREIEECADKRVGTQEEIEMVHGLARAAVSAVVKKILDRRYASPVVVSDPVTEQSGTGPDLSMRLGALLGAALATGELARAVDQVVAEQGVLTFPYTWLQHCQTPLPIHLEAERARLGVDEADWQIRLSVTDNEGFFLDVSEILCEDQFPAEVTFDARGNWWYLR